MCTGESLRSGLGVIISLRSHPHMLFCGTRCLLETLGSQNCEQGFFLPPPPCAGIKPHCLPLAFLFFFLPFCFLLQIMGIESSLSAVQSIMKTPNTNQQWQPGPFLPISNKKTQISSNGLIQKNLLVAAYGHKPTEAARSSKQKPECHQKLVNFSL